MIRDFGPPIKSVCDVYFPRKVRKPNSLYNFYRAMGMAKEEGLILVTRFSDFLKLWQAGFRNVAALMGNTIPDKQAELIVENLGPDGKLTLVLNEDGATIKKTKKIIEKLMPNLYIRVTNLESGDLRPTNLLKEEIIGSVALDPTLTISRLFQTGV